MMRKISTAVCQLFLQLAKVIFKVILSPWLAILFPIVLNLVNLLSRIFQNTS